MANDKDLKDYVHRVLVPPGYRPQSDNEIEKTLEMFDEGPLHSDAVARILGKASGTIPLDHETTEMEAVSIEESVESDELLALHRSGGDTESDEVKEKLEKYRQEAKNEENIDDEPEDNVD